MNKTNPTSRRPGRSNLGGAIITLILEAAVVAALAIVGIGISSLMLWFVG